MENITINLLTDEKPVPPVYFHTASVSYQQSTMLYPPGKQDFYQLLLIVEGTGVLHCCEKSYQLHKGSAFFTAMGCPSEYINTGNLVSAFLTAKGPAMPILHSLYNNVDLIFVDQLDTDYYVKAIHKILEEYYGQKRDGVLSSMTYQFFVDFFEQQAVENQTPINRISLHLQQHFTEKLTLENLAAVGSISISKLCHDFKEIYGCTIFSYILNLRLNYARTFLYTSYHARTKDAAIACGFDDISYFCKAYKKKFGKTPAEDQKNHFSQY